MELKIYAVNLASYIDGNVIGAWFNLPVSEEMFYSRLGLIDGNEEYAIHDYELPFFIDEYERIERLNEWASAIVDLPSPLNECMVCLRNVLNVYGDMNCLLSHADNISFYPGMDSLEDLAELVCGEGRFGEVPDGLRFYIDYSAIARDLDINGHYVVSDCGIFDCPC